MPKVMVFRHTGSKRPSPRSDRIVRDGKVFFVEEDLTERPTHTTHRELHLPPYVFKELRDE